MASRKGRRSAGRSGFTLLELTIVMMILVALAGVMVPMFGGMTGRAHDSAAATNVSELVKQIELYNAKTMKGYPDQFDSLVSGSAIWTASAPGVTPVVPGISPAAAVLMTAHPLTANEATSLTSMGINNLVDVSKATDNASAHQYTLPGDLKPIATGTSVATINDPTTPGCGLANADVTNNWYVIVGLGQSCTAVGVVMAAAPLHFDTIDPSIYYQRYGVIFQVPKDGTPHAGAPAKLVGVVGIHDAGLSGLDDHINGYNQDVQTGN